MSRVLQFQRVEEKGKIMNQYKGHSYSVTRDRKTGKWKANLVVPLRPAKFSKDDFNSSKEAHGWMQSIINSLS